MSCDQRPQLSVAEHLAGTKDSWHGKVEDGASYHPELDRYHLYIGFFCPFAHRVNLVRHLKGLTDILPISTVCPFPKGDENGWPGWRFSKDELEYPKATPDHLFGSRYLHEIYFKADPQYKGRYSVPVLWDKKTSAIVNNESSDLLRHLQTSFNSLISDQYLRDLNFYPAHLSAKIDPICDWMQRDLNTGVYKAGFAPDQARYDQYIRPVFGALNKLEYIIHQHGGPFVLGKQLTEVDLRLYPTIIRFDVVYVQHFKCNLGTIRTHYPQIHNWMKGLYWEQARMLDGRRVWGFGDATTDFRHIKENYTKSHGDINPKAITPLGPLPDVEQGFESDFNQVPAGGVQEQGVLEWAERLPS